MSVIQPGEDPGTSPFSKHLPTLQIAWDSTCLGLLKTCPRKYYYKMIENWSVKGEQLHLDFGIYYHSALEAYDKIRAQGADFEEGLHHAVETALKISAGFVGTAGNEMKADGTPRANHKSRETLVRAIVWYLEHFRDDPAKTVILDNGQPAVELSFRMELPMSNTFGEPLMLSGHMDRLVEMGEQIYVMDRKTTGSTISSYYYKQYSPHNQMSLYTLASRVVLPQSAAGVIIDAAQLAVGFAKFHRGIVTRTASQLEEWLDDFEMWMRMAEGFARSNHWPMNESSCGNYGGCEFQSVCSMDKSTRHLALKSDFVQKVWNPLKSR